MCVLVLRTAQYSPLVDGTLSLHVLAGLERQEILHNDVGLATLLFLLRVSISGGVGTGVLL